MRLEPISLLAWRPRHGLAARLLLAACLLPGGTAGAADETAPFAEPPALQLAAFGTLAWSRDQQPALAPIRDISQRPRDSFATGSTWVLDSRLAAQAAYSFSPELEALVQVVLRDQVDHALSNQVELAHLGWHPAGRVNWRAGRIGYDAFLMGDHRNLGYVNLTVRPPTELYGWVPIFSVDGIEATAELGGNHTWRLQAQFGRSRVTIPVGDDRFRVVNDQLWSLSASYEAGPWRIKGGGSGFRIDSEAAALAPLRDGLEQLAAATRAGAPAISSEASQLRQELGFAGSRLTYATLGASYDDGSWLVQGELARSSSTVDIAPSSRMGYLSAGRRFGQFTPYVLLSASRPAERLKAPANDWSAVGQAGLQATAYGVVNSTRVDQRTLAVGSRWDFANRAAFKLQWDRVQIRPEGYALWFRSPESNRRASTVNLFSASLDFVF
jgi:hypothetical protein